MGREGPAAGQVPGRPVLPGLPGRLPEKDALLQSRRVKGLQNALRLGSKLCVHPSGNVVLSQTVPRIADCGREAEGQQRRTSEKRFFPHRPDPPFPRDSGRYFTSFFEGEAPALRRERGRKNFP